MCYAIIRIELTGGNRKEETFDCETKEKFDQKMEHIKNLQEAKTVKVFMLTEVHNKEIAYKTMSVEDHLAAEAAERAKKLAGHGAAPFVAAAQSALGEGCGTYPEAQVVVEEPALA